MLVRCETKPCCEGVKVLNELNGIVTRIVDVLVKFTTHLNRTAHPLYYRGEFKGIVLENNNGQSIFFPVVDNRVSAAGLYVEKCHLFSAAQSVVIAGLIPNPESSVGLYRLRTSIEKIWSNLGVLSTVSPNGNTLPFLEIDVLTGNPNGTFSIVLRRQLVEVGIVDPFLLIQQRRRTDDIPDGKRS